MENPGEEPEETKSSDNQQTSEVKQEIELEDEGGETTSNQLDTDEATMEEPLEAAPSQREYPEEPEHKPEDDVPPSQTDHIEETEIQKEKVVTQGQIIKVDTQVENAQIEEERREEATPARQDVAPNVEESNTSSARFEIQTRAQESPQESVVQAEKKIADEDVGGGGINMPSSSNDKDDLTHQYIKEIEEVKNLDIGSSAGEKIIDENSKKKESKRAQVKKLVRRESSKAEAIKEKHQNLPLPSQEREISNVEIDSMRYKASAADSRRIAELGSKLAQQSAKLEASERSKQELEDMLLRIEKHFKTEQMLRRKAEISLDQMRQTMKSSELDGSRMKAEKHAIDKQKLKNIQERAKFEEDKNQMQVLIQNAGEEERKAKLELQELKHAATTREEMIQYRLQAKYSATIAKLESEIGRLQEELEYRTMAMHRELQKWRQQAEFATTALREAKNEVIDRKKELDMTKERMDLLVEKLYTSRERGMELKGAIDVQIHQSQLQHEKYQAHNPRLVSNHGMQGDFPQYQNDSVRFPPVDNVHPQYHARRPVGQQQIVKFDEHGTPLEPRERITTPRNDIDAAQKLGSPSYAKPQKIVRPKPKVKQGYAQMHLRDQSKVSDKKQKGVKQPQYKQEVVKSVTPTNKYSHDKDRWTESNRESVMTAYAARWE